MFHENRIPREGALQYLSRCLPSSSSLHSKCVNLGRVVTRRHHVVASNSALATTTPPAAWTGCGRQWRRKILANMMSSGIVPVGWCAGTRDQKQRCHGRKRAQGDSDSDSECVGGQVAPASRKPSTIACVAVRWSDSCRQWADVMIIQIR